MSITLSPDRITTLIESSIRQSIAVKEELLRTCAPAIAASGTELVSALQRGGKILFCGNGGSAADSQHIAAELVIRFRGAINRPALPALALTVDPSMMTAGGNDIGFENVFARLVEAFGREGDVLVGISTSGTSQNVLRGMEQAQKQGLRTVGLLGGSGGSIRAVSDAAVIVPSTVTARIQESHIVIGHIWCEMIEEALFPELFV